MLQITYLSHIKLLSNFGTSLYILLITGFKAVSIHLSFGVLKVMSGNMLLYFGQYRMRMDIECVYTEIDVVETVINLQSKPNSWVL